MRRTSGARRMRARAFYRAVREALIRETVRAYEAEQVERLKQDARLAHDLSRRNNELLEDASVAFLACAWGRGKVGGSSERRACASCEVIIRLYL